MNNALNFKDLKKQYLTVTLADDTVLMIGTPTKAIMDDLITLQASLATIGEDDTNTEATDDLYEACARVMNRNKAGKVVTKEYLAEIFDFEDIVIFFKAYTDFVSTIVNAKN